MLGHPFCRCLLDPEEPNINMACFAKTLSIDYAQGGRSISQDLALVRRGVSDVPFAWPAPVAPMSAALVLDPPAATGDPALRPHRPVGKLAVDLQCRHFESKALAEYLSVSSAVKSLKCACLPKCLLFCQRPLTEKRTLFVLAQPLE